MRAFEGLDKRKIFERLLCRHWNIDIKDEQNSENPDKG